MSTLEIPLASTSTVPADSNPWSFFLLNHLAEFATLTWYLVADGKLVEDAFSRSIVRLERICFDDSLPTLAFNQAKEVLISEAIAVLAETRRREGAGQIATSIFPMEFPDLSRLAFMLRLVVRSSEDEVARLLAVTPSEVRDLVSDAIHYISATAPCSGLAGCPEA